MKVEAIKIKDIRGKEIYYVKITNEKKQEEVVINIGIKNYERIKELTK